MTLSDLAGAISLGLGLGTARGAKALARAIRQRPGHIRVATFSESVARALTRQKMEPLRVELAEGRIRLDDGAADALCGTGLLISVAALPIIVECARVVKSEGYVLIAHAPSLRRRTRERLLLASLMLHAGLREIEQTQDGATIVTVGRKSSINERPR
jgi:ubiquinone/menaquinone biosynthesis C-methylase UbiE